MSTWNYRVIRHKQPRERTQPVYLQIHEVHYDSDGRPKAVSQDAARVGGDSLEEIRDALKRIERALAEPILDFDSF